MAIQRQIGERRAKMRMRFLSSNITTHQPTIIKEKAAVVDVRKMVI